MSKNRRHHYVPAFLLARFTRGGGQDDRLFVFDLEEQRSWPSTARGCGHEKDYYRIEGQDVDPLEIETGFLHQIEGPGATAVEAIVNASRGAINLGLMHARVESEHLYALLRLVAVQAIRGPSQRRTYDGMYTTLAGEMLHLFARNKNLFERQKEGNPALSALTQDDLEALLGSPDFGITVDRTSHVRSALRLITPILETLLLRTWRISLVPSGLAAPLLCSDSPVVLVQHPNMPPDMPFGFGTRGTSVLMPLGRDVLLVGKWFEPSSQSDEAIAVELMPPTEVAVVNGLVIGGAHRYLYCADESPLFATDARGGVGGRTELFRDAAETMRTRERDARRAASERSARARRAR